MPEMNRFMQLAQAQSPIQAFDFYRYILYCQMFLLADNEGPDQTARMRSLIWAFAVSICPKTHFRMTRAIYIEPLSAQIQHMNNWWYFFYVFPIK